MNDVRGANAGGPPWDEATRDVIAESATPPAVKRKAQPMVTVPASTLVVVTDNHGGYKGTECIICHACGWEDRWDHKPDCVVGKALAGS